MKCVRPACLTYYTAMKLKVQIMSGNFDSSYGAHSAIMFIEWIVKQQPFSTSYANSIYLSHMVSGSRLQSVSPPYMLCIIGLLCIYCYCLLIGIPTIRLLIYSYFVKMATTAQVITHMLNSKSRYFTFLCIYKRKVYVYS